MKKGRAANYTLTYLLLCLGAVVSCFPYLMALFTAFKPANQVYSTNPWEPPAEPTLANFRQVLFDNPFPHYLWNTVLFAALLTLGQLVFSTFAAYAFARMEFPGREVLFWAYLGTLMVPNVVTLIPLFVLMKELSWVDTWAGLVAPYILGTPYGIFLMRQFFRGIPRDLEDAAYLDGAGRLRILFSIVLPLSKPIMATMAIITVVQGWNNLLWPLIITSSDSQRVITVGIAAFQTNYGTQWTLMLAATMVALFPLIVLYLLFQRHIVRSIVLSGLK
ncbi:carbohydrate ABC transporter permease [Frankia sp. Cr1]|uniref:carbohydrate ABC transporter permease n=1 Tax=Frankia sp. Cr1 TaxID=3073931 RepID=UPI002AD49F12|nr:carbohydrate ABC transporter permease [Frankia sp. Cr1]